MAIVVYGIPSCDTVRKARKWLDGHGMAHTFVDFRETPPAKAQVEGWVAAFGATAMRNTSGGSFRALPPEKEGWSEARWAEAFASDPMLVRRPVVERDGKPVVVGWKLSEAELARVFA